MKLSTKGRYAVMAMVDLAHHSQGAPVALAEIAERQDISLSYLEQLFAKLRRAGLVRSVRGPGGGYRLARERRRVSVGEIVRVVQGLEEPVGEDGPISDSALGTRVIGPFWDELEQDLMGRLDSVSVEDLCRDAEQQTIESEGRRSFDFVI